MICSMVFHTGWSASGNAASGIKWAQESNMLIKRRWWFMFTNVKITCTKIFLKHRTAWPRLIPILARCKLYGARTAVWLFWVPVSLCFGMEISSHSNGDIMGREMSWLFLWEGLVDETGPSSVNMAGCSVFEFRKLAWEGVGMGKELFCLVSGYRSRKKCKLSEFHSETGNKDAGKGFERLEKKGN